MAFPRVFISSTCYDLGEIRDSLVGFTQSFYFESILSEKGDIFYHPDLHTHDSCINEIGNCHMLILIIGGRFGGKYVAETEKSVTNAEFNAARKLNIPVFTFIKREVFEDHRVYQRNKLNPALKSIEFPSIEKQEYATHIFEFINEVRLSEINNGFFPFEYVKEIKELLGKQWAGMMCDFLNKRIKEKEQNAIRQVLDNLTLVNKKTEEILENIYKKVDEAKASNKIEELDKILNSTKLINEIIKQCRVYELFKNADEISSIECKNLNLVDWLINALGFRLSKFVNSENISTWVLWNPENKYGRRIYEADKTTLDAGNRELWQKLMHSYDLNYRQLDSSNRKKVMDEVFNVNFQKSISSQPES